MSNNIDPQYLGQLLLKQGFKTWFLYLFRIIEGRPFIIEDLHKDLFDVCQNIIDLKSIRQIINLPPRSAKTTLMSYIVVYAITVSPRSNIIYTSFSQSLLNEISSKVANILEDPVYKALYPSQITIAEENTNPVDDFWSDYKLKETKGKSNCYSNRKIQTYAGGTCLFASVGSQITGYGAGIRNNSNSFNGMLVMDDPNKPDDTNSEIMRNKVLRYYEETLLSRLNNSNVPIVLVQQRLHIADLSGLLIEKYKFNVLKKALVVDGVCQLPSQYTEERLKELQTNAYMFSSQYQQEPVYRGGAVIKREWFKYYPTNIKYNYNRILITADTAMKVKEHNDYSAFIVGGVTNDNHLHILDIVHGKWEAPDLKRTAVELFNKWKYDEITGLTCSGLYIEDKASGTGLIQELRRCGIPIIGIQAEKDKLTRAENVLSYIESGMVLLPNAENYGNNKILLDECEAFTRDDSHLHDDIVDALVYNIQEAIAKTKVSLLDFFLE